MADNTTLNLQKEVAEKYDCKVTWNAKILLLSGAKKTLNELTVADVDAELAAGKLTGYFSLKSLKPQAQKEK